MSVMLSDNQNVKFEMERIQSILRPCTDSSDFYEMIVSFVLSDGLDNQKNVTFNAE